MSTIKLIAGLGNPGREYTFTRHNLGFLVVCSLIEKWGWTLKKSPITQAVFAEGILVDGNKCMVVLPTTFMNNSGVALAKIIEKKEIDLNDVLVVCDDLNLEFGHMRLRDQGSDGGHNGLTSIIEHLGTKNFARLRLGIGHPGDKDKVVKYVLSDFSKEEKKNLEAFIKQSADCCEVWLNDGIKNAMDQFNRKKG